MQILLVEDDDKLARLLARRLSAHGYGASTASTGPEGLELASSGRFDMALVDVMLPELDGRELTRALRARGSRMPVLMLTARDAVEDRVAGLRSGADDYLVKPFSFDELLARIEALARRAGRTGRLSAHGVELDPDSRRVWAHGRVVELTGKEFRLLECLLQNAGRVMSRAQLKEQVWDFRFDARTKVVDLYIFYLRRKLQEAGAGDLIETVRGVGYVVGR